MNEDKPSLKVDSIEHVSIAERNEYKQNLCSLIKKIGIPSILQLLSEIAGEFAGDKKVKEPIASEGTFDEFDSNFKAIQSILDRAKDDVMEHMIKSGMV
jgi:hypothetical protein